MRRRIPRRAYVASWIWLTLGFGLFAGGLWQQRHPRSPGLEEPMDCDGIRQSRRQLRRCLKKRDAQQLSATKEMLRSLDQYPSPIERDTVRLQVAASHPRLADSLCQGAETEEGVRLCGRITARPHLYAADAEWVLADQAGRPTQASDDRSGARDRSGGRED